MSSIGVEYSVVTDKYGYKPGQHSSPTGGGENMFLQILTTQLQNQDPLSPLQDGDFINQISGLAQIQESQGLNQRLDGLLKIQELVAGQNAFTQSAALVGKHVSYSDPETGKTSEGFVSEVKLTGGALLLSVNGKDVPMGNVLGVKAGDAGETAPEDTAGDDTASEDDDVTA
jgi:flagellar basal-body rod modification protein FlgD